MIYTNGGYYRRCWTRLKSQVTVLYEDQHALFHRERPALVCFLLLLLKKKMTESNLGKESAYFSLHFQEIAHHLGRPRQESKQRLEAETMEEHSAACSQASAQLAF